MSFLSRLFGAESDRQADEGPTFASAVPFVEQDGGFRVAVVGESYYQDNLESICGRRKESANLFYHAYLLKEDDNPHDDQAVRVEIQGKQVGYLRAGNARAYRRWLANLYPGVEIIACNANVRGGWDRGRGDKGHFGVWLDLPPRFPSSGKR